jgi:hypothetical protein
MSVEQFLWHVTTIFSDTGKHGFVEPHVHFSGIPHEIGGTAQLSSQLFTRFETAVDVKQLEQIDNRGSPVKFLRVCSRPLL